ncbi:MAG: helix-turn-helix domain-containing protein [Candidatus Aenigmatarchaeota archaeon]
MVATQNMLDSLKQIGLNLYERKLWVALLSRGTATAGTLSSLAKVPHSRTYDVLESLADKGFVMIQNTKPLKYVAIPPKEALERGKKRLKEKTDVAISRIEQIEKSPTLKELESIHKKGVTLIEPGEMTGSLKGRDAFHDQIGSMLKGAKKKVAIMTTPDGLRELHEKHGELLKKAAARGVKIRIATHHKSDDSIVMGLKKFAEVRKIDSAAGRFAIVDDQHVVMALTDDKEVDPSQDLALWTQGEHVGSDVIGPMFEHMWKNLSA